MDVSNYSSRAFLWWTDKEGPCLAPWSLYLTHEEGEDYRLGGLLRWTDLPASRFSFPLHGMDRTVKGILMGQKPSCRGWFYHAADHEQQYDGPCVIIGERAAEILRQRHNLGAHEMDEEEQLV